MMKLNSRAGNCSALLFLDPQGEESDSSQPLKYIAIAHFRVQEFSIAPKAYYKENYKSASGRGTPLAFDVVRNCCDTKRRVVFAPMKGSIGSLRNTCRPIQVYGNRSVMME